MIARMEATSSPQLTSRQLACHNGGGQGLHTSMKAHHWPTGRERGLERDLGKPANHSLKNIARRTVPLMSRNGSADSFVEKAFL